MATSSTDLADRITAVLENAHGALDTLDQSNRTGAVADQGAVNMLRKVVQDMGEIAVDARRAAMDEAAQASQDASASSGSKTDSGKTPASTSGTSGSGAARS